MLPQQIHINVESFQIFGFYCSLTLSVISVWYGSLSEGYGFMVNLCWFSENLVSTWIIMLQPGWILTRDLHQKWQKHQ